MRICKLHIGLVCLNWTIFFALCYKLDITLEDEGVEELFEYEIVDKVVAPFDTNPEENRDDFLRGPSVSGYLGNTRSKRSLNNEVCMQNDVSDMSNKIVVVEKGETFQLPCHACADESGEKFEPLQWIKLNPFPNSKGLYHVKEILPGLHDDDNRNRVLVKLDHTLVVQKAKRQDSASYLCTRTVKEIVNKHIPWNELQLWMAQNVHLKMIFHVDVLNMRHSNVVDVSPDAGVEPSKQAIIPALNLAVETSWHQWGDCTVCGQQGLRKRIGLCTVRKLHAHVGIPLGYLEYILHSTDSKIPCQSELLKQMRGEELLKRPTEVQVEECLVPCRASLGRRRRSISKSELLTGEKKDGDMSKTVKVKEGDSLIMVCPGSSITSLAVWVNGTELLPLMELKKTTNKRISYDPLGNLIFSPVALGDAGVYSCWVKEKKKRNFEIHVTEDTKKETIHYSGYLGYVFLVDLGMFFILSVIKYMNRFVQKRERNTVEYKLRTEASPDDESSSTETSSSTSTSKSDRS